MHRDDDSIDFSSLDPARDNLRWERMVRATTARAVAARRTSSVADQLRAWMRPALAAAALVAVSMWGAVIARGHTVRSEKTDSTALLIEWGRTGQMPSGANTWTLLGGAP